jgi:aldose 1-epimerase
VSVTVSTYGATVTSVRAPSQATGPEEVTLTHADFGDFTKATSYYGATCGRGQPDRAGQVPRWAARRTLATNNGPNALHGGVVRPRVPAPLVVWVSRAPSVP